MEVLIGKSSNLMVGFPLPFWLPEGNITRDWNAESFVCVSHTTKNDDLYNPKMRTRLWTLKFQHHQVCLNHLFQGSQVIRQLTTAAKKKKQLQESLLRPWTVGKSLPMLGGSSAQRSLGVSPARVPPKIHHEPNRKKKSTSAFLTKKMRKTSPTKSQKSHLK